MSTRIAAHSRLVERRAPTGRVSIQHRASPALSTGNVTMQKVSNRPFDTLKGQSLLLAALDVVLWGCVGYVQPPASQLPLTNPYYRAPPTPSSRLEDAQKVSKNYFDSSGKFRYSSMYWEGSLVGLRASSWRCLPLGAIIVAISIEDPAQVLDGIEIPIRYFPRNSSAARGRWGCSTNLAV
jgi:hypothetical protein